MKKTYNSHKTFTWFDANNGNIFKQYSLYTILLIPFIILLTSFYGSYTVANNLQLINTPESWDLGISLYKIPLTTLAVIGSIIGLMNSIFKSEQTHLQIKKFNMQQIKTNFDQHYYKFNESMKNYNDLLGNTALSIMYFRLFPNAKKGSMKLDDDKYKELSKFSIMCAIVLENDFFSVMKKDGKSFENLLNKTKSIEALIKINPKIDSLFSRVEIVNQTFDKAEQFGILIEYLKRVKNMVGSILVLDERNYR